MFSEEIQGLVLDIGASTLRAGYCGDGNPKIVIPSCVLREDLSEEQLKEQQFLFEQQQAQAQEKNNNQMEIEVSKDSQQQSTVQAENIQIPKILKKLQTHKYSIGDTSILIRKDNAQIIETNKSGIFSDWDAFENLLEQTFSNELKINIAEYPLLMSETLFTQNFQQIEQRKKLCEIMYEKFNVPNFFLCKQAVLSCFASGRASSLILDYGASKTSAIVVHDGYALQKCYVQYDIGSDFLTDRILNYLENQQKINIIPRYRCKVKVEQDRKTGIDIIDFPNTHKSYEYYCKKQIVQDIKETQFKISSEDNPSVDKSSYELPDGTNIILGIEKQNLTNFLTNGFAPEEEISPDLLSFKGLQNMITDAINKCDIDIRKELLQNIIVCGGGMLLPGLVDKIQKKIQDVAPPNSKLKLFSYPSSIEKKFSTFIGGSILASLGSFQNLWISKLEYEQSGSQVFEKKCP